MIKCRDRFEEEVEEHWNDKWRSLLGIFTADLKECIPEVDFYFIKRADFYDIVKTFNGQRGGVEINKLRNFIQNRLIKFRHNKYINVVGQGPIDTVNYYIGDKNFYNSMKDRDTFHYYKILCTSRHLSNCCSNFICEYDRFGNDRKYLIDEELGALCIAKTDTLELKIGQFERIEPELLKTIKDTITKCYVIDYKVKNVKPDNNYHLMEVAVSERDSEGKGQKTFYALKLPIQKWVKIVVIISIFVLLILFIVLLIISKIQKRKAMGITKRKCPACGNRMKDSWDYCPFCKYLPDIKKKKVKK